MNTKCFSIKDKVDAGNLLVKFFPIDRMIANYYYNPYRVRSSVSSVIKVGVI